MIRPSIRDTLSRIVHHPLFNVGAACWCIGSMLGAYFWYEIFAYILAHL
jgi:hypothetical protein